MSNGVSEGEAWRRRAFALSRKMADAYAASAPAPEVDETARRGLASALARQLEVGLVIRLSNSELGDYVNSVISEWERFNGRVPGPRAFEIDQYDDVRAIVT